MLGEEPDSTHPLTTAPERVPDERRPPVAERHQQGGDDIAGVKIVWIDEINARRSDDVSPLAGTLDLAPDADPLPK